MKVETVHQDDPRLSRFECDCGAVHQLKKCCQEPSLDYLGEERSEVGHRICLVVCRTCQAGLIWIEDPPG